MDAVAERASEADNLEAAVARAQTELRKAVQIGGMTNDPLRFALEGFALALGAVHKVFAASVKQHRDAATHLDERIEGAMARNARSIDDDSLRQLHQAAASGAERRAATLARAYNRRSILLAAGLLAGTAGAGLGSGYWWGRSAAAADIHETEADLIAAFRTGPAGAAEWRDLMRWNDLPRALSACDSHRAYADASGRRACSVPLWISPPPDKPPL